MAEELVNKIKEKIDSEQIKMKPHYYFVMGSIAIFIGILGSLSLTTFFTSTLFYRARMNQGFGCDLALNQTPWVLIFLTLGFLALGIYLFEKYDISYKVSALLIAILIAITVVVSGYVLDNRGIHQGFRNMPMMNRLYKNNQTNIPGQRLRDGSGAGKGNRIEESRTKTGLFNTQGCR